MELNTNDYKIVALINKTLESGPALNTIAHLSLGLIGRVTAEQPELLPLLNYQDFRDADGKSHPFISGLSLIVLRGTNAEVHRLCREAADAGLLTVNFHHQMTGETWVEQLDRSAHTPEADLTYHGVITLARKADVDPLTRKYSLWR